MDFSPPAQNKNKFRNSEEMILEDFFMSSGKGEKNISLMNTTSPSKPGRGSNLFKQLQFSDKSVFKGQIS